MSGIAAESRAGDQNPYSSIKSEVETGTYGGSIKCNMNDTIILRLQGLSGSVQWQESVDLINWTSITDANHDTLIRIANKTIYYRALVTTGDRQDLYTDAYKIEVYSQLSEYRSAQMGLYLLQQKLVDQLVVLGELRADLLEVTLNADQNLIDIQNFNVQGDNPYASPVGFYRLIAACNSLISDLELNHPEVLIKEETVNNYDRLYSEVLSMRAWAYFNAARIYGRVPLFPETVMTANEIETYVNTPMTLEFDRDILFAINGYNNDTTYNFQLDLEDKYIGLPTVIDVFTAELEGRIKEPGSIIDSSITGQSWDAITWNRYATDCLLGQMYLYDGNYVEALRCFDSILYNQNSTTSYIRFGLDHKFEGSRWRNILLDPDPYEHIYSISFNHQYHQQHDLQNLFSTISPNRYQLKPTADATQYLEAIWRGMVYLYNPDNPELTTMLDPGYPGDYSRGHGVSYSYVKDEEEFTKDSIKSMLNYKMSGNYDNLTLIMEDVDTVVSKYSYGKSLYTSDADFMVYRAGGVHLYAAEIYTWWEHKINDILRLQADKALSYLNDGSHYNNYQQLGVRGRVGFGKGNDAVHIYNTEYLHDPFTNEITGCLHFESIAEKQPYLEEKILDERARELAFEGERFYDLVRIAKRRNAPAFLADRVASKFSGSQQEMIRSLLMDEENWYVPFQIDWADVEDYQQYTEWIDDADAEPKEIQVEIQADPGVLLWYPFNGNVLDMSGNGNNGTASGGIPATSRFGTDQRAFWFDGIDDRLTVTDITGQETSGTVSFSLWINPDRINGKQTIIRIINADISGISCFLNNSTIVICCDKGDYILNCFDSGYRPAPGEWLHVAGIFTGDELSLFLNGELSGNIYITGASPIDQVSAEIGFDSGLGRYFTGTIDDVRIFGRALTKKEIRAYYKEILHPDFSTDLTAKKDSLTVHFKDISEAGSTIISWNWDFNGDGMTDSQEQNPVHTFDSIGIYTVSLRISDGYNTRTVTKKDLVEAFEPEHGLIAFYPLNGNAEDATGNGNTGKPVGVLPAQDRVEAPGNAFWFDGNEDYISVQNNSYPSGINPLISFSGWICPGDSEHFGTLFSISGEEGTGNSIVLGFGNYSDYRQGGDRLFVLHGDMGKNWNTGVEIHDTMWHQVVYVFDGTYDNLYLDGKFMARNPASLILSDSTTVYLGYWEDFNGSDYYLNGKLDQLRFFDRALSINEVEYYFESEKPRENYQTLRLEAEKLAQSTKGGEDNWNEEVKISGLNIKPQKIYSPDYSGDTILVVVLPEGYQDEFTLEFPLRKILPGYYRMLFNCNISLTGEYGFYMNGEKKYEIDLYDLRYNLRGVTGLIFLPSGNQNKFDFWAGRINDYGNISMKIDYQGPGLSSNNGLALDYLELIKSDDTVAVPEVETLPLIEIGNDSVICSGLIIDDGGDLVSERGICWSTDPEPGIYDHKTTHGTGTAEIRDTIGNLWEGIYYVRAYASNSRGTAYGQERSFTIEWPVTVQSVNDGAKFRIYPSPSFGELYIESSVPDQTIRIEVISISGSILFCEFFNSGSTGYIKTDISSLNNGIYLVRISDGSSVHLDKIVLIK